MVSLDYVDLIEVLELQAGVFLEAISFVFISLPRVLWRQLACILS